MSLIAADIETGPLPDKELLRLYDPPDMPGLFDPATVDVGRATKKETIDKKIAEAQQAHTAMVADWGGHLERHKAEWLATTKEKAALDPMTGRVLAIGWWAASEEMPPGVFAGNDETVFLEDWWSFCDKGRADSRFVFHNGFGFDLPFLVRRSWLIDVSVPDWVFSVRGGRVYFNQDVFLDTMTAWCMDGRSYVKLDTLARAFGIEGKLKGCTGADFDRMWHGTEKERQLALRYLEQDVRITMQVAQRMGL